LTATGCGIQIGRFSELATLKIVWPIFSGGYPTQFERDEPGTKQDDVASFSFPHEPRLYPGGRFFQDRSQTEWALKLGLQWDTLALKIRNLGKESLQRAC
jgi:hypothetical protein